MFFILQPNEKTMMQKLKLMGAGCMAAGILAFGGGFCPSARAEVRLPKVFSSHMVLQRQKALMIWGWAQPNETVTVQISGASAQAQANERGEWKVTLPAMEAGGPYKLTVSGSSTVKYEDVMVGEVWLCSGQSNMEMGIRGVQDAEKEIAEADHPQIRLLKVAEKLDPRRRNRTSRAANGRSAHRRRSKRAAGTGFPRRRIFLGASCSRNWA